MSAIVNKIKEFPYMTKMHFGGKATFAATGRMRTIDTYDLSLEDCIASLRTQGYVDPFDIVAMPPEIATESQQTFAAELGLSYPTDITKRDMTFLISKKVDNDGDPKPGLLEYATNRNMVVSNYIGKKALYDVIFDSLEGCDKVAFFLFCVYRYCSDDRYENLDTHPRKDVFYALAQELTFNEKFMTSMNKHEGSSLRYFGTLKVNTSNTSHFNTQGGGTNTIAYKKAHDALKAAFPTIPFRTYKSIQGNRPQRAHTSSGNKWLPFFLCLFLGFLGVHKFYQGNAKMGIIYLLTVGLFGIGWFIDSIILLIKALTP